LLNQSSASSFMLSDEIVLLLCCSRVRVSKGFFHFP
jgi:hypothetical protein